MSNDLLTEISAINAIYPPTTIIPSSPLSSSTTCPSSQSTVYTLTLPDTSFSVSLILSFPSTYPALAPEIDGTASIGIHAKRGTGHHVLETARTVLKEVWREGEVVLFDLIEELGERLGCETTTESKDDEVGKEIYNPVGDTGIPGIGGTNTPTSTGLQQQQQQQQQNHHRPQQASLSTTESPPPPLNPPKWTLSTPHTLKKSTFLARACPVHSPAHAAACLTHLLEHDKQAQKATHNISAYRIRGKHNNSSSSSSPTSSPSSSSHQIPSTTEKVKVGKVEKEKKAGGITTIPSTPFPTTTATTCEENSNDDGESAAGGRLLKLMQLMEVWDVLVVVSRWYGGVKLGPARFGAILGLAREVLVLG